MIIFFLILSIIEILCRRLREEVFHCSREALENYPCNGVRVSLKPLHKGATDPRHTVERESRGREKMRESEGK